MMTLPYKRYTLLVGNYGSGKTELAIAMARDCRRRATGRVALVDLDIVNPYFRSGEQAQLLQREGIEVKMPTFAMSTVDIPALPADIQAVFQDGYQHVFMDVGGDDTGAAALGRYYPFLAPLQEDRRMLYVVNPLRPLSGTVEDIVQMFRLIEGRARLRPDMLVNNANLQEETLPQHLEEAQALLAEVSAQVQLPIGLVAGHPRLYPHLSPGLQALYFSFQPLMKPEWLRMDAD